MAATYQLITSNTVGAGGVASVTFSSIPNTYTDLLILSSARSTSSTSSIQAQFNGNATGYTNRELTGSGSAASSSTATGYAYFDVAVSSSMTANTFSNGSLYIPNYTGSTNKSSSGDGVQENNATAAYMNLDANLWANTAAITSIVLNLNTGSFAQYSTFYLYGIKNS